ncbi:Fimbrial assembly family protein [Cellulomonas flavigena DSM 20109]|uniref:Fimbrial assembly family protein n=1 Tax=Cellulomonas flavigena (strain ATCC 482 / DSM 20109 / BCRC 11376 / JCM 18109 / NBRC 3775 / NCIMB 8073 / NRS 134) TaxID=446466 RepID=D5UER8_CELFN|nr:PilN domain-containing protein [Cellulomonas flavigena]ADG74728.1 Fimbrial assembly family protein [Cellulomonas flavigena DSM 20109]
MSTLLERPKGRGRAGSGTVIPGTLPQVNLLPPEVRAARNLRTTKRWLLVSLGLTVVACAVAFGLSLLASATAATELAEAQDETARLQAEQLQYAEVPLVLGMLQQTEAARELGMSTEIPWKAYVDAFGSVLPPGVSVESLTVTQATPMAVGPAAPDVLREAGIGQIRFEGRAVTLPDVAAWIEALDSVPGFTDASVEAVQGSEEVDSGVFYQITTTVQVTQEAYADRFAPTDGEG